jgi:peroxiredoxin
MTEKTHKIPVGITDHCTINQIPKYKTLSETLGERNIDLSYKRS